MCKLLKSFVLSLSGFSFFIGGTNANTGRSAYNVVDNSRVAAFGIQRMPTMSINQTGNFGGSTGNTTQNVQNNNSNNNNNNNGNNNTPNPKPDNTPRCTDGTFVNSEYTVENCLNDVLSCINNGALPGGLNDLFNEDLRNSVFNGMSLCSVQVDKCVNEVRRNCKNIYTNSSDFWIDFNSRKIQPEYYSFVLRKTGLTPNQAENTCWLLDKNTYGSSFSAVSDTERVTNEYNNQVGAYNGADGGSLAKAKPQGKEVTGNVNIDSSRGYYARWDATKAECLIRIAAYNKDSQIKNSWLFGSLGDEKPAEAWKAAGSSFSCKKDLFGFSLLNDTATVAVVGGVGGTAVGAGIGAIAGHGDRGFSCENSSQVKELGEQIRKSNISSLLSKYLPREDMYGNINYDLDESKCESIVDLYDKYQKAETFDVESVKQPCTTGEANTYLCFKSLMKLGREDLDFSCHGVNNSECVDKASFNSQRDEIRRIFKALTILKGEKSNRLKTTLIGTGVGAASGGLATAITAFVERNNINCRVGDGLEKINFGKSYTIDSLKDFYVKWNLKLPDTILPKEFVTDCDSLEKVCKNLKDLNQCAKATVNYNKNGDTRLIYTACKIENNSCIANKQIAKINDICEY